MDDLKEKDEAYWQDRLTPEQFAVCRQKGTERAFSGKYWDNHETGMYHCVACDAPLFSSDTKFESGTGWPSFDSPAVAENVEAKLDLSYGMVRTEVLCRQCGSHLGHLFEDGPRDTTGLRYCINSASLDFKGGDFKAGDLKAGDLKAGDLKAGDLKAGDLKAGDLKGGEFKGGKGS